MSSTPRQGGADWWLVMLCRSVLLMVVASLSIAVVTACGGRGGVSISVSPREVTLEPGETVVFTATVQGRAGTGVMWTSSGGDLVPSGLTAVFTAPAEMGTYTVTATSAADHGRWSTAVVTVAAASSVVWLDPVAVTLDPGDSQRFVVHGAVSADSDLVWSASGGVVVPDGLTAEFVAPAEPGGYEVSVWLAADSSLVAVAPVIVSAGSPPAYGDLLGGDPASPALGEVFDLPAIPAAWEDVADTGLLWTRVEVLLDPSATVADVNGALDSVRGRISSMQLNDIAMTIAVPHMPGETGLAAVVAALEASGAFWHVAPAWTPLPPTPGPGPRASLVDTASLGGEAAVGERLEHLVALRMLSAWNVAGLAWASESAVRAFVPDFYFTLTPSAEIADHSFVAGSVATTRISVEQGVDVSYVGNHGFHVAGILGAEVDDAGATGAHPGNGSDEGNPIMSVDSLGLRTGLAMQDVVDAVADGIPVSGRFVLNTSLGYADPNRPNIIDIALHALRWRALTSSEAHRFFHASAAGNDGCALWDSSTGACVERRTDDKALSRFSSPWNLSATLDDLSEYLNEGEQRRLNLVKAWYEVRFPDASLDVRSANTLIVGSSDAFGDESGFSNEIFGVEPGVRVVGEQVYGPCVVMDPAFGQFGAGSRDLCDGGRARYSGTSMASPQVAALGAYLWSLNSGLTSPQVASTILAAYRDSHDEGLVDALAAVLAVTGDDGLRELLDVDGNGRFDDADIYLFLSAWLDAREELTLDGSYANSFAVTARLRRFILNGARFYPGAVFGHQRFDLDRDGAYGNVSIAVPGKQSRVVYERFLTDLDILCYFAYDSASGPYEGDHSARDALLSDSCASGQYPDELPSNGDVSDVRFVDASAGYWHTLALDESGVAWSWGDNYYGQLGDGTTTDRRRPVRVMAPPGATFVAIDAAWDHSLAIDQEGGLWAWGYNGGCQLGATDDWCSDESAPARVLFPGGALIVDMAAGRFHSIALDSEGRAWGLGTNREGQLGDGSFTTSLTPVLVTMPRDVTFSAVRAGALFSIALDTDGNVWAWGDNRLGQLGMGDGQLLNQAAPVRVATPTGTRYTQISAGGYHVLALDDAGSAWSWGYNLYGELGLGPDEPRVVDVPAAVRMPVGVSFVAISTGRSHSFGLEANGSAWAWGLDGNGQLGNLLWSTSVPDPVAMPQETLFTQVTGGHIHSAAIDQHGRGWAWGHAEYLGNASVTETQPTPVPVDMP